MASKSNTIIYFVPHQDDELLSMGVDICKSVSKGKDVHVVLCTDGSSSSVKNVLNNGKQCNKHPGEHIYKLSIEEFIKARDNEFIDSCKALGIKYCNIHIPDERGKDGSLDLSVAVNIVKKYLMQIDKNAIVCTISQNNGPKQHRDHKTLGKACENLQNKGIIRKLKLFIEPYHFDQIRDNAWMIPVSPTVISSNSDALMKIKSAISSYSYWNPQEQRYAVGYHSVTNEFNDYINNTVNRFFIKINLQNMAIAEKIDWQHKKWLKYQQQKQLYYSISECKKPDLGENKLINILAGELDSYRNFCEEYKVSLTEKNIKRIADGSSFWCIVNNNKEILSSGWLAYQHHFYIGETDFEFDMKNSEVGLLYNFNTKEEYRGRGLYGLLLNSIVTEDKKAKEYIIYTSADNSASQKGILKAGFIYDGALLAKDGSLNNYLKSKRYTNITRKYRLWGLFVSE